MTGLNLNHVLLLCSTIIGACATAHFDFVIVGGGTAGVALGARLSQYLPSCQVLIVEAGPDGRGVPAIDVPGLKGSTLGSVYDWDFSTVPQPYTNNRTWSQNRGRVLGGSSALNLLSYDRAAEADLDAFEELGNYGWNWETLHGAMKKAETWVPTNQDVSTAITDAGGVGQSGPIHFQLNPYSSPQQETFFPAMERLGISRTDDFLNGKLLGFMRHTSNILNTNRTRSYSPSYLAGAGPNLNILLNTTVKKVNIDSRHRLAKGITLMDGTVINAKREVLLCAGAFQSPQLLELSGIGNSSILKAAGIEPKVDLPSVGENLQDHVRIVTAYQLKDGYTSTDKLRFDATFAAQQLALYHDNRTSIYDATSSAYAYLTWPMSMANQSYLVDLARRAADLGSTIDLCKLRKLEQVEALEVPQLEVLFNDGYLGNKGYPAPGSNLYGRQFVSIIASLNHLFSRGNVHLNASDPEGPPLLDPRYLSNAYDLRAVVEGAKFTRRIAQTLPLSGILLDEYEPGLNVTTDEDWINYVKDNALSIWHPMGTCAMLPKCDGGVVDPELRVYGLRNLRVADASIMPILISGHIQTAVYGIAEHAAMIVAKAWAL